jgi:hypothetical protein
MEIIVQNAKINCVMSGARQLQNTTTILANCSSLIAEACNGTALAAPNVSLITGMIAGTGGLDEGSSG